MEPSVVPNKAQFLEFVHEEIDASACGTNNFRQSLLRYFGNHFLRLVLLAILSEQQKSARQALFAGVEKLVDQVFLDPDVAFQHIGDEAVGECTFSMEHANHFRFFNNK